MFDGLKEKSLPTATDAERAILAIILLDNQAIRRCGRLTTLDFYSPFHGTVFEAMLELDEENKPIDAVLIGEHLKRAGKLETSGGIAAVANLTYGFPPGKQIAPYVAEVRAAAARRNAMKRLVALLKNCDDLEFSLKDLAASLSALESELRDGQAEETDSFKPLREIFEGEVLPTLDAYFRREASEFLIPTGFPEIDKILGGGLYLSDMLAVVAPPKSAKSAFALQLALKIAEQGETVALLSLEMSNLQNGLRFIAQKSFLDSIGEGGTFGTAIEANWLKPGIYESTYRQAAAVAASLYDTNLYLCQKPLDWEEFEAEVRRLVKEKNLRVIIVDYWQLMANSIRGLNRTEVLADTAKKLKRLGQELNICVVALGQFNQEGLKAHAAGKELNTMYLEGSGELVKSANIVLTLDIKPADLYDADRPRDGTMTFRPLRSAADAQLECLFFGKYLAVEILKMK